MTNIEAVFRDDNDKMIIVGMFVLSIFFFILAPLLVILCGKQYISENSYRIAKALFNLELLLFLLSLISLIPILGWIVGFFMVPILMIINILTIILNLCAIAKRGTIRIFAPYEFI